MFDYFSEMTSEQDKPPRHGSTAQARELEEVSWTAVNGPPDARTAARIKATPRLAAALQELWADSPPRPAIVMMLAANPAYAALVELLEDAPPRRLATGAPSAPTEHYADAQDPSTSGTWQRAGMTWIAAVDSASMWVRSSFSPIGALGVSRGVGPSIEEEATESHPPAARLAQHGDLTVTARPVAGGRWRFEVLGDAVETVVFVILWSSGRESQWTLAAGDYEVPAVVESPEDVTAGEEPIELALSLGS